MKRIAVLAAIASGWIAAALVWLLDDEKIERAWTQGYATGALEAADDDAQEAGA